jgi:inosine-uridine nucleoside N-ribohydrolase
MEKIIFDCDNTMGLRTKEIDDGLALYYLLGRQDIELLGITTTFGNDGIERVYAQTQKMVAALNRPDLPLFKGAGKRAEWSTDAANFLAEQAAAHPGEITVLATGPLGNLMGAAQVDPEFFKNLKGIACMGGYLHPIQVGRRHVNELNLSADPEASFAVLNAPCPVTLMNAHICLQAPFRWRDYWKLDFWSRKTRWLVRNWLVLHALFCGIPNFFLWDLLPAVYLSHPELFDANRVRIQSSIEDLEKGTLLPLGVEAGRAVNMPVLLKDLEEFFEILFEAWRVIPV